MNRTLITVTALAAVLGAAAIVRRLRKSQVSATDADTTSTTQPEPQTPASTSHTPSDDHDECRVIGKIDLTQFHTDRSHRRGRIGSHPVSESGHQDEDPVHSDTAQPAVITTAKPGHSSPLDGKESGNWQMPRVVVSAVILLRGEGKSIWQISKATGLGARSISRVLGGWPPKKYPSGCLYCYENPVR